MQYILGLICRFLCMYSFFDILRVQINQATKTAPCHSVSILLSVLLFVRESIMCHLAPQHVVNNRVALLVQRQLLREKAMEDTQIV